MLGHFQHSHLRIEIEASEAAIRDSLMSPSQLQQWLWPQTLSPGLPERLHQGLTFTSSVGLITIQQQVDVAESHCLRLLLSQGIDGFHEWYWGEGWIQSRLEGVSLLPLSLAQTLSLLNLRRFLSLPKGSH